MVTAAIDTNLMRDKLNQLSDALNGAGQGGDASRMIENETRSFLRRQIMLTPPKSKQQGEKAIERDLMKIFTPVNEEFLNMVGSQFGVSGIDTWITGQDDKKTHLQWSRLDPSGSGMAGFHQANRNSRGRTRNLKRSGQSWYSPYVVTKGDFADYLKKVLSHVGRRKAGWAVSLKQVHGTVAGWIIDHVDNGTARGDVVNQLNVKHHPSITMRNYAPGIADDRRIFQDNVRMTARAIAKKMQLIIQGYAYDWNTGKVIRPKEPREAVA